VAPSERAGVQRITLVLDSEAPGQVVRELERLVEIVSVRDVSDAPRVERETAVVRLAPPRARFDELAFVARRAGARVADRRESGVIVEVTDSPAQVEQFLASLRPFGVREISRSGPTALVWEHPATGASRDPAPRSTVSTQNGSETPFHWQADGADDDLA
jgi:acetolactate synthase-1/3 small subunit